MVYPYSSANRTVNVNAINYSTVGDLKPTTQTFGNEAHGSNVDLWKIDMGKEANFTVQISGISKPNMKHKDWGSFLPVKSITYIPVSIETMRFKAGLFSDLPIPIGRKVGRIELDILDTEDHYFENQFTAWYGKTVPDSQGYVGYFEEFVKKFTYTEYNNQGDVVKTYYMEVIMDGELTVTRGYENSELKMFRVILPIVGIMSSSTPPANTGNKANKK